MTWNILPDFLWQNCKLFLQQGVSPPCIALSSDCSLAQRLDLFGSFYLFKYLYFAFLLFLPWASPKRHMMLLIYEGIYTFLYLLYSKALKRLVFIPIQCRDIDLSSLQLIGLTETSTFKVISSIWSITQTPIFKMFNVLQDANKVQST